MHEEKRIAEEKRAQTVEKLMKLCEEHRAQSEGTRDSPALLTQKRGR